MHNARIDKPRDCNIGVACACTSMLSSVIWRLRLHRGGKSVHGVRKVFPHHRDSDSGKSIFVSYTRVFVPASDYIFSRGLNRKNIRRE